MKLLLLIGLFILSYSGLKAQAFSTDTIGTLSSAEVYVRKIGGDSLSSSFCIVIKTQVKAHRHLTHSEQVTILDGEGTMRLGDTTFTVKRGDVVFIPKNTPHAVVSTGQVPLKVISVQAPLFDGRDRVMENWEGEINC